ncbi:radical SAM protein [Polyangium mundeleinium]|uniref:Radical SAM protein n=1 Tax=Polyangium mundeleinium TaxID=2995306 RepID=A0ABT5F8J7_9BACT|nr:radical SAM protein [Polyangium mundeleinium]MDC0749487.1 radical SAM protein [Polyangium mundeleinium]
MSRIAIVFPPIRVSRDFIDYPYFADLGALQAAAVLCASGFEVDLVDALAMEGATLASHDDDAGYVRLGAPLDKVLARVSAEADAVLVAYTPFHRPPSRDDLLGKLLAGLAAHRPDRPMVLADLYQSGQHVVDVPSSEILAAYPEVSVLIRYEAEDVLARVFSDLERQGRPREPFALVPEEPPRLDDLPLPAWDLVDLPAYFAFHEATIRGLGRPHWAFPIDGKSAPILTSRGCPYRCVHCSSNPTARKDGELVRPKTQRRYAPAYLDRLLGDLAARGVRRVHLLDELVNVNERHFDAVLDLLEKHDLRFEIPNGVRADYVLPRHVEAMKGRMTTLSVSAESGVQRVVDEVVDKQLDLGAIKEAAKLAHAAALPMLVHFMIGLPGETKRDINGTLAFALDLFEETGAFPSVQFATPLPGTRLGAEAKKKGRALPVVNDWGPRFQQAPTIETDAFTEDDLRRFKWTFDQRIGASQGPKKVIMNVTYKCNNRCTFCATGTRTQFDGDLDRQRELLVKYRKLGVTLLDFDGGEPTLNPNLVRLVGFARRIGYERVNVTTNARMSSYEDYAQKLVTSGVTSILTSIHGPDAQTHAQNVGVAEAFDQTLAGVKNFVRLAPPGVELGANITLTKSNHKKLHDVAALVFELGLRWFNIQFLTPFGRATSSVCPDTSVAAKETMRVIDDFRDRMKIQVINLPFCFMPGYEAFLLGDMLKLERHMLFVNNEEVNLFEYLRERRVKKAVCETCPHEVFCGGFYEIEDVPEPTWLIRPEDLVRPIAADVPRPFARP